MSRTAIETIVLTGGLAQRLDGVSKGEIDIGCGPLLAGELDAVLQVGIRRVVVVGPGPARVPPGLDLTVTREDPPFGGPTAAVAAALPFLCGDWVLLLACDLPGSAGLVRLLTDAWDDRIRREQAEPDGVVVADGAGRPQWLAGVYARGPLGRALDRVGESTRSDAGHTGWRPVGPADMPRRGVPIGRALGQLRLHRVVDHDGISRDVDTPDDLVWWRAAVAAGHPTTRSIPSTDNR